MKKSKYIALAAILALTACTNTDEFGDTSVPSGAISFSTPFVKKATTRATGDIANGTALQNSKVAVWAEMYDKAYDDGTKESVFSNTELAYADGKWSYAGETKFWENNKKYDFAAFAPAAAAATVTYTQQGTFSITNIPAVQTISNTTDSKAGDDYLVSKVKSTTQQASGNTGVDLTFSHILSRLSVYAWAKSKAYNVKLNSLTLYLPAAGVKASYAEAAHSEPNQTADDWTWSSDFTNTADAKSASDITSKGYVAYTVSSTDVDVPSVESADKTTAAKLAQEFFVAPTPNPEPSVDIHFYMGIKYTISTANGASKTVEKFVAIDDLTALKQDYQTNLFVCIDPSVITFNVGVEDWADDNNFIDDEGHSFSFTAAQQDFHIVGTLDNNGNTMVGTTNTPITYTATNLVKKGATENVLKADVPLTIGADGSYSIASENINLAKLESGATYTLTIASNMNDENSADVSFSFDAMQFKVKTTVASTQFTMPIATGATPAIAILWGDTDGKDDKEILTVDATNRAKTYATAGTYTVRLLASQTNRTQKQIPEFNFSKYPTATLNGTWNYEGFAATMKDNANAQLVTSVDTPVLFTGETDLTGMFWDAKNLATIPATLFSLFPEATSMRAVLATMAIYNGGGTFSITIPEGLFDNNTKVTSFVAALAGRGMTSLPKSLFFKNTEAIDFTSLLNECDMIVSLPEGLFSRNMKALHFYLTMGWCDKLVDFENVFIDTANGITKQNRFASYTNPLNITNIAVWEKDPTNSNQYNLLNFAEYTFGTGGYTWFGDKNVPYPSGTVGVTCSFKNWSTCGNGENLKSNKKAYPSTYPQ